MSILEVLRRDEADSGLYVDSVAYALAVQLLKKHTTSAQRVQVPLAAAACGKQAAMKRLEDFIEHNLEVIKTADWILDLGPEGGDGGGLIVAEGTPEDIAANPASHTGRFLASLLERTAPPKRVRRRA